MSNYQMLQAVALDLQPDPSAPADAAPRMRPPQNLSWWDAFVEFVQDRYDAPHEDAERARRQELPRLLCPPDGRLATCTADTDQKALRGDYWCSLLMHYGFFWRGLWDAGNRGRVVAEFQSEGSFGYEDDEGPMQYGRFHLPGDGGGLYAVCVDLTGDGPRLTAYYDDPDFYPQVQRQRAAALVEALKGAGVETEDELEWGYLEWCPSEEVDALYMHQRFALIDYPDQGARVRWEGFGQ